MTKIKKYFLKESISGEWFKILGLVLGLNMILHAIIYQSLHPFPLLLFLSIGITSILLLFIRILKRCDQNIKKEINRGGKSYGNIKAAKNYYEYVYNHDYSESGLPNTHLPENYFTEIKEWLKLKQRAHRVLSTLYVLTVLTLIILSYSKRYPLVGIVFYFPKIFSMRAQY